jgi:hypothetical protein
MLAGEEASIDGSTLFDGPKRARGRCCRDRRRVVQCGCRAIWDRRQHGGQMAATTPPDGKRCTWSNGRPQAEVHCRRASGLADHPVSLRCLHAPRVGWRVGATRPEGRLPLSVGLRSRRGAQLQKKPRSPASKIDPTSRVADGLGAATSNGLIPPAWFLSMRPGPRQIWHHCGVGRRSAADCMARFRTGTGTP